LRPPCGSSTLRQRTVRSGRRYQGAPLRLKRIALLALLLCFAQLHPVGAQAQAAQCVAGLTPAQVDALLHQVEPALRKSQRGARLWFAGWLSVNAALAAASAGLATLPGLEPEWRDSNWWSAASAGVALLAMLAPPLTTITVQRKLDAAGKRPRERLVRALALLEEGAEQERSLRSGTAQVGNIAVALAQGMYLGLRYTDGDGAKAAAANALGSWLVGEAEILTAPRALTRLQARLVEQGRSCVAEAAEAAPLARRDEQSVELMLGAGFVGARLRF
jgi:hypothetical protein